MSTPPKNKLLSYDSLRHVICHLEPNLRSQIVNRIPGIRSADKSTSVKIRELDFLTTGLKLNDTTYELGIIRTIRDGETPLNGGIQYDLNELGVEDRNLTIALTPKGKERHVYGLENMLSHIVQEGNTRDIYMMQVRHALEQSGWMLVTPQEEKHSQHYADALKRLNVMSMSKMYIQLVKTFPDGTVSIERNVPSPFDMYIQLTKTSPDGTVSIERFNYNQNLPAALKYLTTKLLGHHHDVLSINSLTFSTSYPMERRLPEGLKISARNLFIHGPFSETMLCLKPILVDLDRSLDSLRIGCFGLEDCAHPVVQNAKLLIVNGLTVALARLPEYRRNVCQSVTNKKVVFVNGNSFGSDDYIALIEHWKEADSRDVGTCFKFYMLEEKTAYEALKRVKERFKEVVKGERLLTIPFPNSTQLNISYEAVIGELEYGMPWFMKMEIVSWNE